MPIILDGTNGLDSPDLNITGTGARITGDFSNATIANRVAFQSSTTNGVTRIPLIPNGTATDSGINFYNTSNTALAQFGQLAALSTEITWRSSDANTATFLPMTFYTGGSESLRLSATSKAVILAGGSTSATGTGITFPATQSASSDPNTLDDYEEGTWTPTNGGGMSGFTAIDGTYTKIGRAVQVRGSFSITAVTTNMFLGGLPFTSMNQTFYSVVDQGIPVALSFRRVDNNSTNIQWNVNATGSFSVTIHFTAWYFSN